MRIPRPDQPASESARRLLNVWPKWRDDAFRHAQSLNDDMSLPYRARDYATAEAYAIASTFPHRSVSRRVVDGLVEIISHEVQHAVSLSESSQRPVLNEWPALAGHWRPVTSIQPGLGT